MNFEEKQIKVRFLSEMILGIKQSEDPKTLKDKLTIQKLQQELDKLLEL